MKNKEPVFFLKDIKNSLDKIFKYTDNIEFEDFINDDKTKYPNIPFRQIAGMRDKLIHDYFGIDYEIIWKTIQDKLPEFKQNIEDLIEKHS